MKRKTFKDLGVDRAALIAAATGGQFDHRTCSHREKPQLGCSDCWVMGWLFDDRRNPAHPFYKRDKHLTIIGGGVM